MINYINIVKENYSEQVCKPIPLWVYYLIWFNIVFKVIYFTINIKVGRLHFLTLDLFIVIIIKIIYTILYYFY